MSKHEQKAREIVANWYEGWLRCPTWTEAFQKYGEQQIAQALRQAEASAFEECARIALVWDCPHAAREIRAKGQANG